MAEDYRWVNIDKKEYLEPVDFGLSGSSGGSSVRGNEALMALHELLATDWVGDRVLFLGEDMFAYKEDSIEAIRYLYDKSVEFGGEGYLNDMVVETFTNVSGKFKGTEEWVREWVQADLECIKNNKPYHTNEYGVDYEKPFEGLFIREGKNFKYVLNHTKRVAYSFDKTKIVGKNGDEVDEFDPLPTLMGYGDKIGVGEWVGDVIGVSNECPDNYEILEEALEDTYRGVSEEWERINQIDSIEIFNNPYLAYSYKIRIYKNGVVEYYNNIDCRDGAIIYKKPDSVAKLVDSITTRFTNREAATSGQIMIDGYHWMITFYKGSDIFSKLEGRNGESIHRHRKVDFIINRIEEVIGKSMGAEYMKFIEDEI